MTRKKIWWLAAIAAISLFGIPVLLKQNAWFPVFGFSGEDKLATAVSGFTAPVLSLLSIVLIFMAFQEQRAANDILRGQNIDLRNQGEEIKQQAKIDFTFKLIEQLNNELNNITFRSSLTTAQTAPLSRGSNAISKISQELFLRSRPLNEYNDIRKIIGLARSFNVIDKLIEESSFGEKTEFIFNKKMEDWFYSNLSFPFYNFRYEYEKDPQHFDTDTVVIIDLINRYWPTGQQHVNDWLDSIEDE